MFGSSRVRVAGTIAGLAVILGLTALLPAGGASARSQVTPRGYVFTTTNDAEANEVLVYKRGENGELTFVGAFDTGGTGTNDRPPTQLGPPDTDQSVIVSADHKRLFTVNQRSDTIAVFDIDSDGTLTHVKGSPFPSGGNMPVSLGLAGDKLYVVNKDDDPIEGSTPGVLPNYTGFRVAGNGRLIPIPFSTVDAPEGSSPTQALISPDGRHLFSSDFFALQLRSLNIPPTGRLEDAPGSPIPTEDYPRPPADVFPFGQVVVGLQVHPFEPYVYVGQAANGLVGGAEQVGVYSYEPSGELNFVRATEDTGVALCWFVIDSEARFMYGTNTLDSSVSVFDLSDPANPVEIQKYTLSDGPTMDGMGTAPEQLAIAPGERFLYVTSGSAFSGNDDHNAIYILRILDDGTLEQMGKVGLEHEPLGVAVI